MPTRETLLPGIPLFRRGKVREMYDVGLGQLLMVASDRISAFDVIMDDLIPGKGQVLTALSAFWFDFTRDVVPNHLVSTNVAEFPESVQPFEEQLAGRTMLVRRTERIDVECVVRGYLSGSGWAEYKRSGTLADEYLPAGLLESGQLDRPRFTPAIKAESGHDENISRDFLKTLVPPALAEELEAISLALYERAEGHARSRGLILADTKFEFGLTDDGVILIDEILTPDSSRYWPMDQYQPGGPQPSFDKQPLRDWLESTGWNKEPPPPPLPPDVVASTEARYREALRRLTDTSEVSA
jgi:phosphoribosylaminoimidazole-succinocarboxamide synthase